MPRRNSDTMAAPRVAIASSRLPPYVPTTRFAKYRGGMRLANGLLVQVADKDFPVNAKRRATSDEGTDKLVNRALERLPDPTTFIEFAESVSGLEYLNSLQPPITLFCSPDKEGD